GSTILGREEFGAQASPSAVTQRSVRREGEVCGRHLVLVDTPDWFCPGLSLEEIRQDVGLCVRLSAPGPHAFLLVIPVEPSKEEERGVLERMEEMFGEGCWGHTVILFTHDDSLKEQSIGEFLQAGSQDLQQLVEKCGSRYHVLNIKDRTNDTQVPELLEKIEEMVSGNRESFYCSQTYQETEAQVREMERKIQREMEERKRRHKKETRESGSELRLVLLGRTDAGRRAAGNTILGREEFGAQASPSAVTQRSVRRQGEVCGRHLVLVDTPDWSCPGLSLEVIRQDVGLCVRLSSPGPHAFLLVIPVEPSKEEERGVLERMEEMFGEGMEEMFGEGCWGHTVILFTHDDSLEEQSIEGFLQAGSQDLQQLVEKCGSRYHVLNIKDRTHDNQVPELLEKIEEMVSGNKESFYCSQTYQEALRLVLLGRTGAGRRAAGNTILGREEFGAQASPSAVTQRSVRREGEVCGRHLVLVDTPDWFCPGLSLEEMRQDVGLCVRLSAPGPHAFLLVIPVEPSKEEERGVLERMEEMFGEGCWGHTVILFTHDDSLKEPSIEEFLQAGSQDLQQVVEKYGSRYHVLNIKDRTHDTQVPELLEKIEEMVSGNRESFYCSQTYQETEDQVREMERKIQMKKLVIGVYQFVRTMSDCDKETFLKKSLVHTTPFCSTANQGFSSVTGDKYTFNKVFPKSMFNCFQCG
uniref:AIG1-type G domain-containing protein n=1 Tax=Esox lucius TaxID=8010 RepID=A0A3P8ZNL8_ESOLU